MDQNTAIVAAALLSGLLAGVLTLTGVIVQSVLTYRQTTKAEKRKEIREVIEKVYKLSST